MSKMQITIDKDTKELTVVREFNAPRQMVWDAWTKPELMAKWWGPRAFTTEIREMDVREGGVWYYVMHGTGAELKGTDFENMEAPGKGFYKEIQPIERIVYEDVFVDKDGNIMESMPKALVSIHFEENNGKTTMTSVTKYETVEGLKKVVEMGVEQGMGESLDKLDELLAS